MKFLIVDFETTGSDAATAMPVEIGMTQMDWDDGEFSLHESSGVLLDPGFPIPPPAMAVHHITDDMVKGRGDLTTVLDMLRHASAGRTLVAHNAAYERTILERYGFRVPWLCTMRLAKHRWPDAQSYGLGSLWYEYVRRGDPNIKFPGNAHRAAADTIITAYVLVELLDSVRDGELLDSAADLIAYSEVPVLERVIRFGKHSGAEWKDVPVDYLQWIITKATDQSEDVMHTAKYWFKRHTGRL